MINIEHISLVLVATVCVCVCGHLLQSRLIAGVDLQQHIYTAVKDRDKDKDKDLFIGPQEYVVGYSEAPEQPQSSARPICHFQAMTRTGHEPTTVRIAA